MSLIKLLDVSHVGHLTADGHIPENELRRQFNLGSKRIASLSPARDPFFTIVSKYKNRSTDDPEFKHIEEREIWHRRYGFIMDVVGNAEGTSDAAGTVTGENHWVKATYDAMIAAGTTAAIYITADYDTKGRFSTNQLQGTTIFNNVASKPTHFFKNQVLKIPVTKAVSVSGAIQATGNLVVQISSEVTNVSGGGNEGLVQFTCTIISHPNWTLDTAEIVAIGHGLVGADITATTGNVLTPMRNMVLAPAINTKRREDRVMIIGSSYQEASGLPNTTYTDRLHDTFGFTQIFKTDLTMSNTALATMLKYRPNEYAHRWNKTLLQHKRDINLAGIWGIQAKADVDGKLLRKTAGVVDFIMSNGWVFTLDATKDYDGFLEDMSEFFHPEVAQANGHLFHVSTAVFNWFNRLNSGFFHNTFDGKNYYSVNLQFAGTKKFAGFDIIELTTPHGTMRMVKDVNLDGTGVKIMGINYNQTEYRPLVGNGLNRDTTVYMKVKDVAHTGDDFRTDLVQTEAGFEFGLGETFAMWV